jgi:hypothetical protein
MALITVTGMTTPKQAAFQASINLSGGRFNANLKFKVMYNRPLTSVPMVVASIGLKEYLLRLNSGKYLTIKAQASAPALRAVRLNSRTKPTGICTRAGR